MNDRYIREQVELLCEHMQQEELDLAFLDRHVGFLSALIREEIENRELVDP